MIGIKAAVAASLAASAALLALASPASAKAPSTDGAVTIQSYGAEHIAVDDGHTFGGWIAGNDNAGNGNHDFYRAAAWCYDGHTAFGEYKWAGDASGSFAYCPDGYYANFAYFERSTGR